MKCGTMVKYESYCLACGISIENPNEPCPSCKNMDNMVDLDVPEERVAYEAFTTRDLVEALDPDIPGWPRKEVLKFVVWLSAFGLITTLTFILIFTFGRH